jgi:hypothetical protein
MTHQVLAGEYLTRAELAAELDNSERTIARWDNSGVGPPRTVLVGASSIDAKGSCSGFGIARSSRSAPEAQRRPCRAPGHRAEVHESDPSKGHQCEPKSGARSP